MNESISGMVAGGVSTLIGHPLDTIKTWKQNSNSNIKFNIKNILRGYKYPLLSSITFNGYLFGINNYINNNYYDNHLVSGAITGFSFSFLVNPFELYKVRKQCGKKVLYTSNPLRGICMTLPRETIGCSFYFGTYNYLKNNNVEPLFGGAIAGIVSWTVSYPFDTMKTKIQLHNKLSYKQAFKQGNYWKGFNYCILRAVIVNSIVLYTYEYMMNSID